MISKWSADQDWQGSGDSAPRSSGLRRTRLFPCALCGNRHPETGATPPEFAPIGARWPPLLETTSGVAITPLDAFQSGPGRFSAPAITAYADGRQVGSHLWPRTPRKTVSGDSDGHAGILQSALAAQCTVHNPAFQRSFYGQIMSQKCVKNRVEPGPAQELGTAARPGSDSSEKGVFPGPAPDPSVTQPGRGAAVHQLG